MNQEAEEIKKETIEAIITEKIKRYESTCTLPFKDITVVWGENFEGERELITVKIIMGD